MADRTQAIRSERERWKTIMNDAESWANGFREQLVREGSNFARAADELEPLSPPDLVRVIPILGMASEPHGRLLAQTASALLSLKLSASLVQTMKSLDESNARLAKVGWWLTIAVGLAGVVVPLVIALYVSGR
jgi:hypothetical protein